MRSTLLIHPIKHLARHILLACTYTVLLCFCFWLSLLLRFDFSVPPEYWLGFQTTLLWLLPLKLLALGFFGQFRTLLTFFSLSDAKRLLLAMVASSLMAIAGWYVLRGHLVVPRGVILTDFILSLVGLVSLRTGMRVYREQFLDQSPRSRTNRQKVAIIGAGSAGSVLFREIQSKPGLGMDVICFIDDDTSKVGGTLHGRKIAGTRTDLPFLIKKWNISRAIIAIPSATPTVIRETVDILNGEGTEHDILPSVTQLLHKQVSVSHLRHVEPEDLLGRIPVALDEQAITDLIKGKIVMVTGAGGSIGSELCRQVALLAPSKLLLVERSEPSLFQIEQELYRLVPSLCMECLASSVTQEECMEEIFKKFHPEIVFHAAAHKHVPLMEQQPVEAILNNVLGTLVIAQAASKHQCKKMILVSTDKAVNPTNVMGATKRVAELLLTAIQDEAENKTNFSAVRFGNVLGSSGSVIPTFRQQIARGGPITVTHPEITRYFMSIPEAVGLILQSATQTTGGEVFVLDMGEPIKIRDLARQMIELSGFTPEEDIQIEYTGLRPGEKLYEEPIHQAENVRPTNHLKVKCLIGRGRDTAILSELRNLEKQLYRMSDAELKQWLALRVPEYKIWNSEKN